MIFCIRKTFDHYIRNFELKIAFYSIILFAPLIQSYEKIAKLIKLPRDVVLIVNFYVIDRAVTFTYFLFECIQLCRLWLRFIFYAFFIEIFSQMK